MNSPIKYRCEDSFHSKILSILPDIFSAKACFYHYSHMANGNNRGYLQGEEVRIKKYFYVLRPILAMRWIEKGLGVVPTEFQIMLDKVVSDSELKTTIYDLIESKKMGFESKFMKRIDIISNFIDSELLRFEEMSEDFSVSNETFIALNKIQIETIKQYDVGCL